MYKKTKYGSRKVTVNGETFDSVKEYRRYCELRLLEKAGKISNLERQKPFELIPAQYGKRCIEKSVVYNADFYYKENGAEVVEDTKSVATKTKDYIIKRKLLLYRYGIKIKEV